MKLLRKLLIINWHYIDHELLELENVNFLTGKNASGKSTIIDAMQLLFLGDTNAWYFNKAANERSRRTLKGYLRCEVGDDGETGSRYQRTGDFSSYIVAEFTDTLKRQPLTVGIVFDSYSDDKQDHRYFIMNNSPIPQNHFLRNNVPMSIRDLQAWCKTSNTRAVFYETNKRYQEDFLGIMGGLREKFFKLFRKAVPFTPTHDIEEFISEFVCDVTSEVNIAEMQQNIRIYRDLEFQAEKVRVNITALRGIGEAWQKWNLENSRLLEQQFLYDRAEEQRLLDELDRTKAELQKLQAALTKLAQKEEALSKEQEDKRQQAKVLQAEIERSDIRQKEQNLTQQINRLQEKLQQCTNAKERLQNKLHGHIANWADLAASAVQLLPETKPRAEELQTIFSDCKGLLELQDFHGTLAQLPQAETLAADLSNLLADKRRELRAQLGELEEKQRELQEKIRRLEQGIKSFDPRLEKLRDLIQTQVPGSNPRIFCDLLEISDERWQNAIEGYLHTQKFYLLVEPAAFIPALRVYDREKQKYNLHSFGLVDVEKLTAREIRKRPGSLAEYITTEDPHARALADYLLGRVIGCAQVEEIRNHEVAITQGCMLYQNYVARQLDPQRYRDPFIGKQAIRKQIENAKADLAQLEQEINKFKEELDR
ncbi:MAG: ATP-binding protein, partial [Eubacteriales bacterium]|nr:ATP-binding protein [Eubacteriales bacterium]